MEIKKTSAADLDNGRTTRFLLAVIVVLAAVFVALEYNTYEDAEDGFHSDMFDDTHTADDILPVMQRHDMVPMVAPQQKAERKRLKIVETTLADREETVRNATAEGTDSAVAGQPVAEAEPLPIPPAAVDAEANPLNFRVVEDLPQFPGGAVELMKWLTGHLRYPLAAERQHIDGKVVVQFVVNADGSISDVKVVKPVHEYLDREALRVVRLMPKWKPGVQNGKPCRTMVCIPVVFRM